MKYNDERCSLYETFFFSQVRQESTGRERRELRDDTQDTIT